MEKPPVRRNTNERHLKSAARINKVFWGIFFMRKILVAALVSVMLLSALGCNAKNGSAASGLPVATAAGQSAESTPTAAETEPAAETAAPETTAEPMPDYAQLYSEVLNGFYDLIANSTDDSEAGDGQTGVWEAVMLTGSEEAMKNVGYVIEDISGDGVPELMIAAIDTNSGEKHLGREIYACYTYANGAPYLTFEGWARSSYSWIGGGSFLYSGSSGAACSYFGTYSISDDGTALVCNDNYFTYPKDDSWEVIGFYHNTTGDGEPTDSTEELTVEESEFWQIEDDLMQKVQNIALTPFSDYQKAN